MSKDTKQVGIRLPVDIIEKLTAHAETRMGTLQDVVRAGILLYMEKYKL